MPQFGSNPSVSAQNLSATQDPNGNPIISSENGFGASPLGVAARTQALYGIPNAHFDLTCPDPTTSVEVNNAIPYWDLEYSGTITTTMVYDATTQNWSVRMDPTGAASGDYAILKARTYLLNDSDLALRQKAYASLTKQGTTGTAQWSIVLSATYYDITGTQLSTYNIGTAADTGTWTGISGVTTSGSAAISTNAAYADIALTLTAAGSVSGTAKVDINSVLIATSQAAGGGSFLLTQTFTSSGTWTRPTGVDYVTVVLGSGGQGGGGGGLTVTNGTSAAVFGGAGGKSGGWVMLRDIALGTATSVSVGVGAGGAGGTANTFSKASGSTTTGTASPTTGADGGASTFGSYVSIPGGNVGGAITYAFLSLGGGTAAQVDGGNGAVAGTAKNGLASSLATYTLGVPFTTFVATGAAGVSGSASGGTSGTASAGGSAQSVTGILGGGGGGGNGTAASTSSVAAGGTGGAGGAASGGGAAFQFANSNTRTVVVTGGAGGSAVANTGSGGGGGGAVGFAQSVSYSTHTITANSGAGGSGAAGFVTVVWVG